MPVQIRESISVAALFEHGKIKQNEGTSRLLHFSAAVGRTLYELVFNTQALTWRLKQVSVEIS